MSRKKWWLGSESSGGAPLPAPMLAVSNLRVGNYFITPGTNQGWPGSAGGFFVGGLVQIEEQKGQQYFIAHWYPYGNLLYSPSAGFFAFICAAPGPSYVFSPYYTIPDNQLGKVITLCGVLDAIDAKVRLYINGQQVGNGTATSGYQTPTQYSVISGDVAAPFVPNTGKVYGVVYGNNARPSAANVAAWHLSCKTHRKVMEMPNVNNHGLWRVNADSASSGIPDLIGSANLSTVINNPIVVRTFSRFAA